MTPVDQLVKSWLELDQDEDTRREIEQLHKNNDAEELELRLRTRLSFGTAGLRARMGAGFSRINSLTIIQTAQGLSEFLLSTLPDTRDAGLVIGYDGRHHSSHFAKLVASIFIFKQIKVWWYEDVVHTPLVPFAVKHLEAAGGVMITASHNPAMDNGFKVYGANVCQINSPVDSQIATSILENLEPLTWDVRSIESSPLKKDIRASLTNLYVGHLWNCLKWESFPALPTPSFPSFVYTPMHGVGLTFMQNAVGALVCPIRGSEHPPVKMVVVSEQAHPDPDFPTVRFPNPEEDGALDLAKATADREDISLIVANDPDADRLAVAEKVGNRWVQFTGDQLGILLAHFIISTAAKSASIASDEKLGIPKKLFVLASAVSSQMLAVIAASSGITFEETLTGFKWLGSRALKLQEEGHECIFAYEEALGYMIPSLVFDKDGVLAASAFLSACAQWGSPWTKLQTLYEAHGYFVTRNTYWKSNEIAKTSQVFARIRGSGQPYPSRVADRNVLRWRDLTIGYDSGSDDQKPHLPSSPDSQMITCWLSGEADEGIRFTIRASGTEPKIKLYLECKAKTQAEADNAARSTLGKIGREWFNDASLTIEERYKSLVNQW